MSAVPEFKLCMLSPNLSSSPASSNPGSILTLVSSNTVCFLSSVSTDLKSFSALIYRCKQLTPGDIVS